MIDVNAREIGGLMTRSAPLGGIVVADFSHVLAGPYATMMLGDLGADVIKIEQPGVGDSTRGWGPPFFDGESSYYLAINRSKRSAAIDLATPDGYAAARKLIARADILVENHRPRALESLGLGYESVRPTNPGLVYCSISGFGTGLGASMPGYDLLIQAMGGLMSVTGEEGRQPVKVGAPFIDVLSGLNATVAILAALHERRRSGLGQRIEITMLNSCLAAMVNQSSSAAMGSPAPRAMGNRHPNIAPYETFSTAAGTLVLAVGNHRQFQHLCMVVGAHELLEDARFSTNVGRIEHRAHLTDTLERHLRSRPAREWATELMAVGVPAGEVNDISQAIELATSLGLRPVIDVPGTDDDPTTTRQIASPIVLSRTPIAYTRRPPRLGEHTREVLGWLATEATDADSRTKSHHPG